jgi:hypothetical protein
MPSYMPKILIDFKSIEVVAQIIMPLKLTGNININFCADEQNVFFQHYRQVKALSNLFNPIICCLKCPRDALYKLIFELYKMPWPVLFFIMTNVCRGYVGCSSWNQMMMFHRTG